MPQGEKRKREHEDHSVEELALLMSKSEADSRQDRSIQGEILVRTMAHEERRTAAAERAAQATAEAAEASMRSARYMRWSVLVLTASVAVALIASGISLAHLREAREERLAAVAAAREAEEALLQAAATMRSVQDLEGRLLKLAGLLAEMAHTQATSPGFVEQGWEDEVRAISEEIADLAGVTLGEPPPEDEQ